MRALRRHHNLRKKIRSKRLKRHGIYTEGRLCSCYLCKPWKYMGNSKADYNKRDM